MRGGALGPKNTQMYFNYGRKDKDKITNLSNLCRVLFGGIWPTAFWFVLEHQTRDSFWSSKWNKSRLYSNLLCLEFSVIPSTVMMFLKVETTGHVSRRSDPQFLYGFFWLKLSCSLSAPVTKVLWLQKDEQQTFPGREHSPECLSLCSVLSREHFLTGWFLWIWFEPVMTTCHIKRGRICPGLSSYLFPLHAVTLLSNHQDIISRGNPPGLQRFNHLRNSYWAEFIPKVNLSWCLSKL